MIKAVSSKMVKWPIEYEDVGRERILTELLRFHSSIPENYKRRISFMEFEPKGRVATGKFIATPSGDETEWHEFVVTKYPHAA